MADKKYLSKIVKGSDTLWVKDAEARQEIEDIKSSITASMHYIGVSSTAIADGDGTGPWTINSKTYIASGTPASGEVLLVAGDVAIYTPTGKTEREFVWSGTQWQELGSTGSLKALAFKDSASATYTPAGTNAASVVSFTGQTTGNFVTGFDTAPVAPSFTEGTFSAGTLPSFTEGSFTAASLSEGFYSAGTAPSFTEGAFSQGTLPSLGAATTGNFNTDAEKSTYDESNETLTFSAATTAAAVTAQGTFDAGSLPSKAADTFSAGTVTTLDLTKFNGGSKAADTWSAGTLPSKDADTWSAGTVPTLATSSAVTAVGTGEAAAQTFTGTEATITVS